MACFNSFYWKYLEIINKIGSLILKKDKLVEIVTFTGKENFEPKRELFMFNILFDK